jgi:protein transport protein SEC31
MAPLKQIDRSATVGFCPTPAGRSLLAAGTVAGAIDMSFSTNAVLEIFSLDFASGQEAPVLAGSIPVPERFNRLAWGVSPSDAIHMPVSSGFGSLERQLGRV